MKSTTEIRNIIAPILLEKDLFLVDVTASTDNVIEVYIDSMRGVSVKECMTVNRALEAQLDRESTDFSLTVYSAGIGFPFKVPQQYEKNVGKSVVVKLSDGQKIEGTLLAHSASGITIAHEEKGPAAKKRERITVEKEIPFTDIKEVRDVVTINKK
ncbi:MAG: ribosome assembly cofactor RimP [Odoribacteraceae bacterium]|jgi:ribosome maturation factor RimP|nr:ribosome assembly cofactor RimP [Odoribacteraceae bacterium]